MYEDVAGTAELLKAIEEVRDGKLERLTSLEELGASPDKIARLLLEVLEPVNYQRLVKSYSGSYHSPPLREICQLCVNERFRSHHR